MFSNLLGRSALAPALARFLYAIALLFCSIPALFGDRGTGERSHLGVEAARPSAFEEPRRREEKGSGGSKSYVPDASGDLLKQAASGAQKKLSSSEDYSHKDVGADWRNEGEGDQKGLIVIEAIFAGRIRDHHSRGLRWHDVKRLHLDQAKTELRKKAVMDMLLIIQGFLENIRGGDAQDDARPVAR
mmetsp:Transcript_101123/g.290155  ORF Transcript_101123/g.290155 Transcript_101123/m.290155 type:complete len:187 (-) Transcript_101123:71-631(-)